MSDEVKTEKTPLLIVAGPTATGKSDSAVELALRMNGEVISADSMQVYRGMDIGSAKVTVEEMRGVPHHLIDCADPSENWNVVRFQKEARRAVQDISSRGRLPILCGGTGFYIQALLYDIDFTQMDENTPLRDRLSALAAEKGPEAVHALLAKKDPTSAAAIHPNNLKRVIRAIESAYRSVFFVLTMDRARLYERIDRRVDTMMERGLVEEVARLRAMGIQRDSTSMQGIGYKQVYGYLDGEYDLEEAVRLIKRDTRHFAKRQLTWFKREKDVIWTDLDRFENRQQMWDHMQTTAENIIHYKGD